MELELQSKCRLLLRQLKIKYFYMPKTHATYKDNDINLKGLPDLFIFYKSQAIAIEFKNEKKLLSESQIIWRDYLMNNGFKYYLIREYDRFLEVLKENNFI